MLVIVISVVFAKIERAKTLQVHGREHVREHGCIYALRVPPTERPLPLMTGAGMP